MAKPVKGSSGPSLRDRWSGPELMRRQIRGRLRALCSLVQCARILLTKAI